LFPSTTGLSVPFPSPFGHAVDRCLPSFFLPPLRSSEKKTPHSFSFWEGCRPERVSCPSFWGPRWCCIVPSNSDLYSSMAVGGELVLLAPLGLAAGPKYDQIIQSPFLLWVCSLSHRRRPLYLALLCSSNDNDLLCPVQKLCWCCLLLPCDMRV